MSPRSPELRSLVELLQVRAHQTPDACAYIFLEDGDKQERRITHAELDRQARRIATALQNAGFHGGQAVLLYPPGLDYVAAFFGCLYAGVVAVPAYPPNPARLSRTLPRLQAIISDSEAQVVLTTAEIAMMAQAIFEQAPDLEQKLWIATNSLDEGLESAWKPTTPSPETVAFLQYTSGSTGAPKGVILSHGNLLANLDLISAAFEIDDESVGVSWLPPYHDMGLIGGVLAPLYKSRPTALMSPIAFLQRPLRWLTAITNYGATISGGPNFAYELCIRKVRKDERAGLDLRSWNLAFSGAEPVRPETLNRFVEAYAPYGFDLDAFYPCYGLAEATLIVSGGRRAEPPVRLNVDTDELGFHRYQPPKAAAHSKTLVGCGRSLGDQHIRIVDPHSLEPRAEGEIGEVWVAGASVSRGYWKQPQASNAAFGSVIPGEPHHYLRTGDLGFLHRGELFVTGRVKDMIIIRGRNHYPQDIEVTAEESHQSLRRGCCAAFAIEVRGEESLVIAVEVERRYHQRRGKEPEHDGKERRKRSDRRGAARGVEYDPAYAVDPTPSDPETICSAIRTAVMESHHLHAHDVVLIKAGSLPKTSSGKVQRRETSKMYDNGALDVIAQSKVRVHENTVTTGTPTASVAAAILAAEVGKQHNLLGAFLRGQLARALKTTSARIDPDTPVNRLGLDSLMAIDLGNRIERLVGVSLPLTTFLRPVTLNELTAQVLEFIRGGEGELVDELSRDDALEVSHGQQALWFLQQIDPQSSAYNLCRAIRVHAPIDMEAFRETIQILVDRHRVLRTTYEAAENSLTAREELVRKPEVQHVDGRTWDGSRTRRWLAEFAERPFELETGPLYRIAVLELGPDDFVIALAIHHIVADLWSMVVLLSELRVVYTRLAKGHPPALRPVETSYGEFVRWQSGHLHSRQGEQSRAYWHEALGDAPRVLSLPTDHRRPPLQTFKGADHKFTLDRERASAVRAFSLERETTVYVVLLAAYVALLQRYSGSDDIVVGSPVSGRTRSGFSRVVGYLVNMVPMRSRLAETTTFAQLVDQVRATVLDALEHQDYPFPQLVKELQPNRDPSMSPLFQVMFSLERAPLEGDEDLSQVLLGVPDAKARLAEFQVEPFAIERSYSQFDLAFIVLEHAEALYATLTFNVDLFESATIERMAEHFKRLIDAAVREPETPLTELSILGQEERHRILHEWNATTVDFGPFVPIVQRFEQQCVERPQHPAVRASGREVTYAELNRRANELAHFLKKRDVGPGKIVGLCFERCIELAVAIVAVHKAGAAYLPLDPNEPEERLAMMLKSANPVLVLSHPELASRVSGGASVVEVNEDGWMLSDFAMQPKENLGTTSTEDDPAYVIFTSGSTGAPKGVVNVHRGLHNRLLWMQSAYPIGPDDRVVQKTPYTFDVSVWEFLWPLMTGATLVVAEPEGHRDAQYLGKLVRAEGITVMHFVPSMLASALEVGSLEECRSLRHVICSGEALAASLCDRFFRLGLDAELHNLYGPTEASIDVSYHDCDPRSQTDVPIGRPIANTQLYVLDQQLEPVPVGVAGEIYIGGAGLAQGYLGREELTRERFIPSPFTEGARLYRTGDRGRFRSDGAIDYLGRLDGQVKLRGFRIELGEVEAAITAHPDVVAAAVVMRASRAGDRLVAYCEAPGADDGLAILLREALTPKLPDYMIPAAFVFMEQLPRTSSGKIDRRALPRESVEMALPKYEPPRNAIEEAVAELWAELLERRRVGLNDNFFALGGHSLLATHMVVRLNEVLPVEIPIRAVFERPTVAALCDYYPKDEETRQQIDVAATLYLKLARLSDEEVSRMLEEHDGGPPSRRSPG